MFQATQGEIPWANIGAKKLAFKFIWVLILSQGFSGCKMSDLAPTLGWIEDSV